MQIRKLFYTMNILLTVCNIGFCGQPHCVEAVLTLQNTQHRVNEEDTVKKANIGA